MRDLLAFFDDLCLEEGIVWEVASAEGDRTFIVMWQREDPNSKRPSWLAAPSVEDLRHAPALEAHEVPTYLDALGVDLDAFERELMGSVLTYAAYAETVLQAAERLVGPENLEARLEDARRFLDGIADVARRRHLRLVKDDEIGPAP